MVLLFLNVSDLLSYKNKIRYKDRRRDKVDIVTEVIFKLLCYLVQLNYKVT